MLKSQSEDDAVDDLLDLLVATATRNKIKKRRLPSLSSVALESWRRLETGRHRRLGGGQHDLHRPAVEWNAVVLADGWKVRKHALISHSRVLRPGS